MSVPIQRIENANYSYRCTATNSFGFSDNSLTNGDLEQLKKLESNLNIIMFSIGGAVGTLLLIAIVVCRCVFISAKKSQPYIQAR